MVIKIPCSGHKDCFANTNGYCTCLMKAQFESELENTRYTLTKKGRTDLIEMYHRRRVNAQKQ